MISTWSVNPTPDAMQRRRTPLALLSSLWTLQAIVLPGVIHATDVPVSGTTAPAIAQPPREAEVFPFLKDGTKPRESTESTTGNRAAAGATNQAPTRPTPSGYLNRLGVAGTGTLRFEDPPHLVEESISMPAPPMLTRPLISASYSRGPREWEGNQPMPLRPVTETSKEPPAVAVALGNPDPAPAPASGPTTGGGTLRVEAGGASGGASTSNEGGGTSRVANEFRAITPFFQVSPWPSPPSNQPGMVLQFIGPDARPTPANPPTLKSRAVYEAK